MKWSAIVLWASAACLLATSCGTKSSATEVRLVVQTPYTDNYPTHFAQWLGYFDQEGLHVTISQVAGPSKVLEAVVASSADVGSGVYEQAIQTAAEGREVKTFLTFTGSPNFAVLAGAKAGVYSIGDLKGKSVGVSSLGSPSQFYLNHLLRAAGVQPEQVSTTGIGMGATAAAALEQGQVEAAVLFDSAITTEEGRGARVLADVRTREGARLLLGTEDYPASSLLARSEWLAQNPETARRVTRAVLKSLSWIREHSPAEILAKVPSEFRVGDPLINLEAIRMAKPMYSIEGRVNIESAQAVRRVLSESLENVRRADIDLSKTFTNEYLPK
jgi:NitT/TauT family transport system substrate-binding protein